MNDSPIYGKVARILNSREIVINVGSMHGVTSGMMFDILDAKGVDIRDPETNEILGSVERPKIRVKVTSVHEKLSIASTYKKKEINIGGKSTLGIGSSFAELLMPPKYVAKYETLKTTEKTWEDLSEEDSFVKTGDPVKQVSDDLSLDDQIVTQSN